MSASSGSSSATLTAMAVKTDNPEQTALMAEILLEQLKQDGFVRFENFFSPELTKQAYREIQALYETDLQERAANGIDSPHYQSSAGRSALTKPSHLLLDIFTKSPTLDQMFETFLTHPVSAGVLAGAAGPNIKMRGFNIRRMTGSHDPAPLPDRASSIPHEWHIDSPGELCISFLFTDVPGPNHASTAFVPGTHSYPYNPRWENLFSKNGTYKGHPFFIRNNIFNKMLADRVFANATGGYGKAGDAFLFINDTWHGRQPNLFGHQAMISFAGLFSTNYPFPDKVDPPPAEILNQLPPRFREVASNQLPPNTNQNFYMNQLEQERLKVQPLSLFHMAQLERKLAERISPAFALFDKQYRKQLKKAKAQQEQVSQI